MIPYTFLYHIDQLSCPSDIQPGLRYWATSDVSRRHVCNHFYLTGTTWYFNIAVEVRRTRCSFPKWNYDSFVHLFDFWKAFDGWGKAALRNFLLIMVNKRHEKRDNRFSIDDSPKVLVLRDLCKNFYFTRFYQWMLAHKMFEKQLISLLKYPCWKK